MARAHNRSERSVESIRATTLFVIAAIFVGVWVSWDALFYRLVTYSIWADYWEHTATLTEWLRNFDNPGNPHLAAAELSPRYMPWFWLLTWAGLEFGLDSIDLMAISSISGYLVIVSGIYLFSRAYFRDYWAPLITFLAIFTFWGISWNWSNLYQLRSFFYIAGYPSSLSFGISLIAFWAVLKTLRKDAPLPLMTVFIAVLAALMFLCHPLTGVFGLFGCALLTITDSVAWNKYRIAILIALLAGALAAELWPYFSVWKLTFGLYGTGDEKWFSMAEPLHPIERFRSGIWQHIFYDPNLVLVMLGPALLGIPVCLWLLWRKECLFIVGGALGMAIPYFAHLFVEIPLAHRFLLFAVFYLHLALVWLILRAIEYWQTDPAPQYSGAVKWSVLSALALGIVANVFLSAIEFRGETVMPDGLQLIDNRGQIPERRSAVELYTQLTEPLPDTAVVLAPAQLGWPLPTIKGKVVSLYHENPMVIDQAERGDKSFQFFYSSLDDQARTDTVRVYNATHVLVNMDEPALRQDVQAWLDMHSALVAKAGPYRMHELINSTLGPASVSAGKESPDLPPKADSVPTEPDLQPTPQKPASTSAGRPARASSDREESEPTDRGFGAPIAKPLIDQPAASDSLEPLESIIQAQPEAALPPAVEDKDAARPDSDPPPNPEPAAKGNFGAPITNPILDPDRHGD